MSFCLVDACCLSVIVVVDYVVDSFDNFGFRPCHNCKDVCVGGKIHYESAVTFLIFYFEGYFHV